MKKELLPKLSEIKLFLFDLEGVLLSNTGSLDEKLQKEFINQVEKASIDFQKRDKGIGIVTARIQDNLIDDLIKLDKFPVLTTSIEKVQAVEELVKSKNLSFKNLFYMGDEVLDIPLLLKCGLSAAPKNAIRDVKRVVNFTLDNKDVKILFSELLNLIDKSILTGIK